jgi:hypothetical protein
MLHSYVVWVEEVCDYPVGSQRLEGERLDEALRTSRHYYSYTYAHLY